MADSGSSSKKDERDKEVSVTKLRQQIMVTPLSSESSDDDEPSLRRLLLYPYRPPPPPPKKSKPSSSLEPKRLEPPPYRTSSSVHSSPTPVHRDKPPLRPPPYTHSLSVPASGSSLSQYKTIDTDNIGIQVSTQLCDASTQYDDVIKQDATIQFNYLVPSTDHLYGVHIAEKKLFYIQGNEAQSFYWEEYGLRLHSSQNTISLSDTCEVAITVLIGGHFKFPKGTKLVSAVYDISVAKQLLKPLTLEIQHCVNLQTQAQANCLHFATASFDPSNLPYQFTLLDGGQFYPSSRYGSITSHFCPVCILAEYENQQPHGESDDKESSDSEASENSKNEENGSTTDEEKDNPDKKCEEDNLHDDEEVLVDTTTTSESDVNTDLVSGVNSASGSSTNLLESPPTLSTLPDTNGLDLQPEKKGATPILSFMYTGMTYYEEKDGDWIVRFAVVKDLNALLKFIKEEYKHADKDDPLDFNFVDENGFVELILPQEQPPGWKIVPKVKPCKLWQASIDKFGSTQHPIPASCQLIVCIDDEQPGTVKHLFYPISLEGITPPRTITIHRKLIRKSSMSGSEEETSIQVDSSIGPTNTDIDISTLRKLMRKVLTENCAALEDLPKTSLPKLATEMFAVGLISSGVRKKPTFDDISNEFLAGMSFKRSHTDIQEYAKKFLRCLNKVGGSFAAASKALQDDWTLTINKELKVEINFLID